MIFTYIFARSPNYGLTNRAFGGNIYRRSTRLWKMNMGVFPSGQWGQTVNLLLSASVVRIHPRPPRAPVSNGYRSFCFISFEKGDARVDSNSIDPPNSPAGKKAPAGLFLDAWLAQSTHAHQKNATYQNTLRFFFTIFFPAISASPTCQSSCARILFCTISPAGVRARVRPSKVAYPARTQFCTKASCAVENCLPYRAL